MSEIVILGGANIDIVGYSHHSLIEYDSNPGKIKISYGGVGRNIAENCCRLEEKVKFATVFGHDHFASILKQHCLEFGFDLSLSKQSLTHSTSIYLAVLDQNQDMKIAISDMDLLQEVDDKMVQLVLSACSSENILVMDTNLDQKVIEQVARQCACPIYLDPISCAKAVKVKHCLGHIHTLKPNRYEAEILCGFAIKTKEDKNRALDYFLAAGVREIIISLGDEGVLVANDHERYEICVKPAKVVNATGGGDSFLAAWIAWRQKELLERCLLATAAAISTITVLDTVNPQCSRELIEIARNELEMEGRRL